MLIQLENGFPKGITNLWTKSPSRLSDNANDTEASKGFLCSQVTSETKPRAV